MRKTANQIADEILDKVAGKAPPRDLESKPYKPSSPRFLLGPKKEEKKKEKKPKQNRMPGIH